MGETSNLRKAAEILTEAAKNINGQWYLVRDEKDVYVEGENKGEWYAYTGNDKGADQFAKLIILGQPILAKMLAEVFKEHEQHGTQPAHLEALADAVVHVWGNLEK